MARTNKWTIHESKADSRYFTHNGNFGSSPNSIKRDGKGKNNWGEMGDELNDLINSGECKPVYNKQRRGSNVIMNELKLEKTQMHES